MIMIIRGVQRVSVQAKGVRPSFPCRTKVIIIIGGVQRVGVVHSVIVGGESSSLKMPQTLLAV